MTELKSFYNQQRRRSFVTLIIFINLLVYIGWFVAGKVGPRADFMADNFLVSFTGLLQGHVWILLTSAFSHNLSWHFILNMFVLNSFGRIVEFAIGSKRFIQFYLIAAIFSSLGHAVVSAFVLGQPEMPALGASGAIAGVVLLFSLMFPKEKILILGLIPMPAIWGAFVFVGLDVWGLISQASGGGLPIGHGAHLGGALTGIIYFFWLRYKLRRQLKPTLN